MAASSNRFSVYSNSSAAVPSRSVANQASQVSTTSLLNALHTFYTSGQSYQLESGTSLVVNTWLTTANLVPNGHSGGVVDSELARRAWEHARRRAEDGCILLCSLHRSTPSLLVPFLSALPLSTPPLVFTALSAISPFLSAVTPFNPSYSRHSSLAISYTFTLAGTVKNISISLSTSGIDITEGLLNVPAESGYRAFDVFYYLLNSVSTPAEREYLNLKDPSGYALLNRSGTFTPPSYLPTADDAASAEDFRTALKAIGIKGPLQRGLISVLAGLLKLGNTLGFLVDEEELEEICEEVGGLLGVESEVLIRNCTTDERHILIAGIYEALVDWMIQRANEAIMNDLNNTQESGSSDGGAGSRTQWTSEENADTVSLTVVDIPSPTLGKAVALRGVFDDTLGINAEMREDGIEIASAGHSVVKEMNNTVAEVDADLGFTGSAAAREREHANDKRQAVLERVGWEAEEGGFLRSILIPSESEGVTLGKRDRFDLTTMLGSSRVWHHLSLHPTDERPATIANLPSATAAWSAGTVSRQLRDWRLPEWANRRRKHLDFTADFDVEEFVTRYSRLGCKEGKDGVENWIIERGWSNGDVVVGHERIWMREGAWWEAETMLDLKPDGSSVSPFAISANPFETGYSSTPPNPNGSGFFPPTGEAMSLLGSRDDLLQGQNLMAQSATGAARSIAPTAPRTLRSATGDYGLGAKGDQKKYRGDSYDGGMDGYAGELDAEFGNAKHIEKKKIDMTRRIWVTVVWILTWWIPSFVLRYVGRMKRPDVRMAWREKLSLMFLILLFNAVVIFYIVEFGNLLCPNKDKVWNTQEVSYHQGDDDFYVSIHGSVYDISKFWKLQHSDTAIETSASNMQPFAGQNLDAYFPPPLTQACSPFVTDASVVLQNNDTTAVVYSSALHTSGPQLQTNPNTALHNITWYANVFLPKITEYYKGDVVWTTQTVQQQANDDQRYWSIINNKIYDLTNYFYTLKMMNNFPTYSFLPSGVTDLFQNNPGSDITNKWQNSPQFDNALNCLNNMFYVGDTDFRTSPRCTVNNWILLAFTILIASVILAKFLAALQFGTKRRPAPQDKFVICQVPAYTEGEDQLRKGLDSLTALQYDNKRKLICVICDGMIVGGGNNRPTPKIVLDILGVDPKIDPPALPFKSVGHGSDQLNYGKVYSGLYECEGNVVPYIVIVKVGKESEQTKSKPGNRGKRDSQCLLMNFLNRVHHRSPMSPLELEVFHQINNVIGVDPELYEYLLMVDADTSVKEDALNRLVSSCANDAKIAGICGETSLQNEERSWWTMIQVYEYYISHHLAKAFESLFGSVTCLPGCFCMYRLRTVAKGQPLIISDEVIREYADGDVDTLHKKNLLALGEDRFLTTLMMKHFPQMSYKFVPNAKASTAAPETWSVLLSQRRRWINSTIHNLVELAALDNLCGFCCFSMRFVVLIDLLGTVILPATCVYLGYLVYTVVAHKGQFPLISIIILACVYGLQAIIFIVKRQWQHIGWMIIYILAFPIYGFILPLYSFWNQDNFSWGNTRVVIGEKGDKRVIAHDDEGFDPRSIPLQRWDDYALANNLPGRRRNADMSQEKYYPGGYTDDIAVEMDDMHSTYSSVKPASTILTGFPHGRTAGPYIPPQSPAPFGGNTPGNRTSHLSSLSRYTDHHQPGYQNQRHLSVGNLSTYQDNPMNVSRQSMSMMQSSENLLGIPLRQGARSPLAGGLTSRPVSTIVDFRGGPSAGPDEVAITEAIRLCLAEVDLESVTKKQVRALVEQRLQTELVGDKRAFLDRQIDLELANM